MVVFYPRDGERGLHLTRVLRVVELYRYLLRSVLAATGLAKYLKASRVRMIQWYLQRLTGIRITPRLRWVCTPWR